MCLFDTSVHATHSPKFNCLPWAPDLIWDIPTINKHGWHLPQLSCIVRRRMSVIIMQPTSRQGLCWVMGDEWNNTMKAQIEILAHLLSQCHLQKPSSICVTTLIQILWSFCEMKLTLYLFYICLRRTHFTYTQLVLSLLGTPKIKMDDASPLPSTFEKWSQNILDSNAAIFAPIILDLL